ncbi:glycosyltransferase family protein [Tellurirhabdus bombi]|uniref:hypothetical protein n=1 Tax=Tellurirhabdus bombi TaxID=2907205 RepID=UPI001F15ADF7|nr:hypothetical protein [Tellurirhabdus bombi]
MRKICLFTAHSPLGGGGGVILRSLVENIEGVSISWKYLAENVAKGYESGYWGRNFMGGSLVKDLWLTSNMLMGNTCAPIDQLVKQLLEVDCDAYWIISHNEGLRVAFELARVQSARPVHLTVHDDWAGALCVRSIRYRLFKSWAKKLTIAALKQVTSFDVISSGMQTYYLKLSGKTGEICHRYLPSKALIKHKQIQESDPFAIVAGHIGSVYSKADFINFLKLFKEFANSKGKQPVMNMWGCHLTLNDIPSIFRSIVHFKPGLPEGQVIPELAKCDFVYSMYPMNKSLKIFSETSLPTKLTSYVQASRPIFGHCPLDSTLAKFIEISKTGVVWSSQKREIGIEELEKLTNLHIHPDQWIMTRDTYFGESNLNTMLKVFLEKQELQD